MKRVVIALLLGALVAIATGTTQLSTQQQFALTTIDSVPSSQQLISATVAVPEDLVAIAGDSSYEPAVRLRAIHGLAVYCTTPAVSCPDGGLEHQTLAAVIAANANAHAGAGLLLLRAAIESDGPLQVTTDIDILVPLLDHPSRDIRAATARALAQLCNTSAADALRVRYQNESTDQVKLAISAALRTLGQPSLCRVH